MFYDILERKNAFLGYKNKKLKQSKIDIFPWVFCKIGHFSTFFLLGNIGQENVFCDILERKNAFLGYKKEKLKKVEKLTFFQRG